MNELVRLSVQNGVATLTIDNPPVNALSATVANELAAGLNAAFKDTSVNAIVEPTAGRGPRRRLSFLVDSGAIYTVLPARTWKALGLQATRNAQFVLADGTTVVRGVSDARFTVAGVGAPSPVVCGEEHDSALMGAVTLESLGLMLNPLTRELLPMRLMLA